MERCTNCQFYDRHGGNGAGGKSSNGGQCRRHAPQLAPNTAKNYLIEGVWPTVRDEDWCGEFKASAAPRRAEGGTQRADALLGAIGTAAAAAMSSSASASTLPRVGASAAAPASIGVLRSSTGSD